jgi:hypothetical protein
MTDKAFQIVEDANTLLDETDKLKEQWYEPKETIESANLMGITAQVVLCAALLSRRVKC